VAGRRVLYAEEVVHDVPHVIAPAVSRLTLTDIQHNDDAPVVVLGDEGWLSREG
jgi:hypothetical protein